MNRHLVYVAFPFKFFQLPECQNSSYNIIIFKILQIGIHFCLFFCWYHLPAKCIMVSGISKLAPVSGARNRRQKMVNVSSTYS